MTREEEIKQVAKDILNCKHCTLGEKICFSPTETPCVRYRDIIKMAKWKDEKSDKEKQKLIDEACNWLAKNDSYAIPTNVQVDRLREHLEVVGNIHDNKELIKGE